MRSIYCGQVNEAHAGQTITLCGWVHRRRDLGGLIFIDMRDREGIVQVFFDPDKPDAFALASELRGEFCIQVTGVVRTRPESQRNSDMATGAIEVFAHELNIINRAEPLPLDFNQVNSEEISLKYRYLDLRRPEMAKYLKTRAKASAFVRRFMDEHGFLDIETPMLTKATPEGARDYLVPSRVHKGKFYALPQSPQLFKQLLMMSGFDRYYQIVKCFRDEDLRADRQPEFTQIDVETSFMTAPQVREVMEEMIRKLWLHILNVDLGDFPIMTFDEAMRRYGSDKPDLRLPMELVDVADLLTAVEFAVFAGPANDPKGRVAALKVPGGAELSRKQIDEYTKFVGIYGAKGLAWMKVNEAANGIEGVQSPVAKFLSDAIVREILARHAPPVHRAEQHEPGRAESQPGGCLRQRLRHGDQRLRSGWRLCPYPQQRDAVHRVRYLGYHPGRAAPEVRLPAGCPEVRHPAARRSGLRSGPSQHAADRHRKHSGRHRLPENDRGCLSDDRRPQPCQCRPTG